MDAGVSAPAVGTFPAVVASTWSGLPGDATDGTKVKAAVLDASVQYVITATTQRTADGGRCRLHPRWRELAREGLQRHRLSAG